MPLKLTAFATNPRTQRILAVAAYAGVDLEHDKSLTPASNWKTPELLSKNPFGLLPILELEDGTILRESSAIAEYIAELGTNQTLIPSDLKAKAEVHSWQATADQELFIPTAILFHMHIGKIPYVKPVYQIIADNITGRINVIDTILATKTFLVGDCITLADIFIVNSLITIFSAWFDAPARAKVPNVVRYVETVVNHPKLVEIFTPLQFIEKAPTPQAPAKEQKAPKDAKPKAEKKPTEADEEKRWLRAQIKEVVTYHSSHPAEYKVKNPLDDLPKSSFNLRKWKRQYSDNDIWGAGGSLAWFYEKFDKEGFSIWRVDFKYNEELTQIFLSSNQIGGFFNRLEASRKYLFGSVGVLGKANDSVITGVLVARGQDIEPVVNVAPEWESYSFRRLNVDNADDKAFFEASLAWNLVENGREWADGKNFK
nr:elongation factor 1-gamma [Cryptococcus depauperatus CBS 7855]